MVQPGFHPWVIWFQSQSSLGFSMVIFIFYCLHSINLSPETSFKIYPNYSGNNLKHFEYIWIHKFMILKNWSLLGMLRSNLLMRVKEESEKLAWNSIFKKLKIVASGPITLEQIEWEKVEGVTGFIFLYSKITVDGDCSHEI